MSGCGTNKPKTHIYFAKECRSRSDEVRIFGMLMTVIDLHLQQSKTQKYSQHGEEGIIDTFVNLVYSEEERENLLVCEFGAHDGSNSNLLKIVEEGQAFGVFIECDEFRIERFKEKYSQMPKIKTILDRVGWKEGTDLSAIFKRNGMDRENLKIISIDIDGDDVYILQSMDESVDLVIIEFNPTFSFDTHYSNPEGCNIGSSPLTLINIAATKNLYLAALTETNLVFVNNKYENLIKKYDLCNIPPPPGAVRYAMGYDGTLVAVGSNGVDLTDEVIGIGWGRSFFLQPLPKVLRRFDRLDRTRTAYSLVILLITRPIAATALFRKYKKTKRKEIAIRHK